MPQAQPAQKPCTVVLVPSLVPYQDKAIKELITSYGGSLVFVAFNEHFQADRQRVIRADQESRDTILQMLTDAINVVLLAPPLEAIGKIADADDSDFLTYLFVRAQLWGKKVSVFLDFDLPRFKKNKFQESISDRLKAEREKAEWEKAEQWELSENELNMIAALNQGGFSMPGRRIEDEQTASQSRQRQTSAYTCAETDTI